MTAVRGHDPMCVELNAFDNEHGYTTSCKCERLRAYAAQVRMETQQECRPTQQEVRPTQQEVDALIAKVRKDERSNNFTPDAHADAMTESYDRGYAAALDELPLGATVSDLTYRTGYAAALDAAREAVAGIPHTYWEGIAMCRASHPSYTEDDCNCPKRDALAAIAARGGTE